MDLNISNVYKTGNLIEAVWNGVWKEANLFVVDHYRVNIVSPYKIAKNIYHTHSFFQFKIFMGTI